MRKNKGELIVTTWIVTFLISAGAAPVPDMPQSEYGCRYQKPIVSTSATADKIG